MAAVLVVAAAAATRASAIFDAAVIVEDAAQNVGASPLLGLLEATTRTLLASTAVPSGPHPVAVGSAAAPAAPLAAGGHGVYCNGCFEVFGPGRTVAMQLAPLLLASAPAWAEMVLPEDTLLFLAGALIGALAGLALSSLVVGTNGPEPPRNQPAWP